jgi:hypothetical protein
MPTPMLTPFSGRAKMNKKTTSISISPLTSTSSPSNITPLQQFKQQIQTKQILSQQSNRITFTIDKMKLELNTLNQGNKKINISRQLETNM